jgi:putative DNA-invertase from lambdoid prophage Rac
MATILYARVSTNEQTIEHQRTQAEKAGFKLDQDVWDEGVSGVSTKLAERPRGRRLFDLLREGDTLVVCWVVDWAGTTRTSATPFASLCDAASSSAR